MPPVAHVDPRPPTAVLALAVVLSAVLAAVAQVWLQGTFATVGHPASLAASNTQADPLVVRDWFARLQAQGTLDRMVDTELVDLAWVVSLAMFLVSVTLLASRLLVRHNPAASRRLTRLAPWTAVAPALDLMENAFSLAMLADPAGFPDALAPVHATASWLKLAAIISVAVAVPAYTLWAATVGSGAHGNVIHRSVSRHE